MKDEDIAWSKERIREQVIARKLGVGVPWSEADYYKLKRMWSGCEKTKARYNELRAEIEKELFND
jgi:hypothetical protein